MQIQGPTHLGHLPLLFLGYWQGAVLEVERLVPKMVPIRDACIVASGFSCYTTMVALDYWFFKCIFFSLIKKTYKQGERFHSRFHFADPALALAGFPCHGRALITRAITCCQVCLVRNLCWRKSWNLNQAFCYGKCACYMSSETLCQMPTSVKFV